MMVATDAGALNALCLVGIIPAVFRLAGPGFQRFIRRKAALFQYVCCHGPAPILRLVIICQVRHLLTLLQQLACMLSRTAPCKSFQRSIRRKAALFQYVCCHGPAPILCLVIICRVRL